MCQTPCAYQFVGPSLYSFPGILSELKCFYIYVTKLRHPSFLLQEKIVKFLKTHELEACSKLCMQTVH